jgi:alpha-beta hydrolase superfamily lysophospholipase
MESMSHKLIFKNPEFSFQLTRTIGHAINCGSDIGECISTACRIKDGDFQSWHDEWLVTAKRVHKIADGCFDKGHKVSAREAYFRASEYYRTAEFFLHGTPGDPEINILWDLSHSCFNRAIKLLPTPVETFEIPYEATTIPAYYFKVDNSDSPRPVFIYNTGFDGSAEESYFEYGSAALARGYNYLAFEGPGQGRVIHKQNIPFRYDWEKVLTPVIDHLLSRKDADPRKIALIGISTGGYLSPRAVAFEHRVAACIANGGVFDMFEPNLTRYGATLDEITEFLIKCPDQYDAAVNEQMKTDAYVKWGNQHGMWVFGVKKPSEFAMKMMKYNMRDCADLIKCHMLVVDSEADHAFPGQAKKLFDALKCPKDFILFTVEEGAELHCQVGMWRLATQRIFDWLEGVFADIK